MLSTRSWTGAWWLMGPIPRLNATNISWLGRIAARKKILGNPTRTWKNVRRILKSWINDWTRKRRKVIFNNLISSIVEVFQIPFFSHVLNLYNKSKIICSHWNNSDYTQLDSVQQCSVQQHIYCCPSIFWYQNIAIQFNRSSIQVKI